MTEFKLYFTPKQTEALEQLENPLVTEVLYGGAKGGGKSVLACLWCYLQCEKYIKDFKIPDNPDFFLPIGFMGRKRGVDFVKTTLETWRKMIPSSFYRIRPLDKEIIVRDKVKIHYGGMDDDNSINKFNSAEFGFVFVDQAEEISRDEYGLLKGTLRFRYNNIVPNYKVLLTANPAPSFLKHDFIDAPPDDGSKVFIQALPTDNPFLDKGYVETLIDAFKHRPELIRAYVHGSWDNLEGLDVLIKPEWTTNALNNVIRVRKNIRITSADVARFGKDETVIYNLIDNKVVDYQVYGMKPADASAVMVLQMAKKNSSDLIAIDADGFGGGVADIIKSLMNPKHPEYRLMEIHSGKAAKNKEKYVNAKTEMWFYAANMFAEKMVSIPHDPILMNDLSSIKYFMASGGRFQVESKHDVKKRMSRSPDRGDALVYGIYASKFVHKEVHDFNRAPVMIPDNDSYGWMAGVETGRGYGW